MDVLAVDAERLTARREHHNIWAVPQQRIRELGARVQDMLAVVNQQQQAALADRRYERVAKGAARLLTDAEHVGHSDRDEIRVPKRSEIGKPHPITEPIYQGGGGLEREAGLARAPSARQRYQPRCGYETAHLSNFCVTADEAGHLRGRLFSSFGLSNDRRGGKSAGRPAAVIWKICSGRPRSFNR